MFRLPYLLAGVFLLIVWAGAALPFRFYNPASELPAPFGDDVADRVLMGARRALNSGNQKEAVALAEHALELQPAFSSSWLLKAQALEQIGAMPQALTSYQQAIALDPENYEGHLGRGRVLVSRSVTEALREFRTAAALRPDAAAPMIAIGNLLVARGTNEMLDMAEAQFREALSKEPRLAAAHLGLAHLQLRKGDKEGAEGSLQHALEYDERSFQAHAALATLLMVRGERARAREHLVLASQNSPHPSALRSYLSSLRKLLGNAGAEAIDQVEKLTP